MITNRLKWFQWPKTEQKNRSSFLDAYRGLAVFLMIIFHFCWDLRAFGYMKYALSDPFWVSFRGVIMTLFISAIGWSAYLSYQHAIRWRGFLIRHGKLLVCAVATSLGTYLAFPNNWIFFGILHFIFLASLIVIPVARLPRLSLSIGLLLLGVYFLNNDVHTFSMHQYLTSNFHFPSYTLDFVHPLPWLGVLFFGPILGAIKLHHINLPISKFTSVLTFLGRHALPIYLCHQLVLYSMVSSINFMINYLN